MPLHVAGSPGHNRIVASRWQRRTVLPLCNTTVAPDTTVEHAALSTGNGTQAPKMRTAPNALLSPQKSFRASRPTPPADLNLELWRSLMIAGGSQLLQAASNTADALDVGFTRLRRLVEAPPPGFPPGPAGDQTVALLSNPLQYITSASQQHGGMVGLLLGGERVVLVTSTSAAQQVLIDQADVFIKQGTAFFPGSSLTGNGLLVSDGDIWRRQRRLSNPAFRKVAVDKYAEAMVAATQDMLQIQWSAAGGKMREVYADYNELTLRITLQALFGFDSRGAQAVQVVAAVEKAFEFFTKRAGAAMIVPEWVPTWDNLEFGAAVQQLDKVVLGLIEARRRQMANGELSQETDLLQGLLTAVDEDGVGMTNQALRDELMTLLIAGQETSAILLAWASALLAHHPSIQETAANEVQAVLQGRMPTAADVQSLGYVEAVVLEALRLYSPAYMVGRCACQDAELDGYSLPCGTTVLVSPYVMHRDAQHWPDPHLFKPERWAPVQSSPFYKGYMTVMSNLGPNGAYLPFGSGPRNCIGTGFAMMEAILVLAAVLQRCRLLPVSPQAAFPQAKPLLTLRPDEVPLRILPR